MLAFSHNENGLPIGIIMGRNKNGIFFGNIICHNGYLLLHLFAHNKAFELLTQQNELSVVNSQMTTCKTEFDFVYKKYTCLYINSATSYDYTKYRKRNIELSQYKPSPPQLRILDKINKYYEKYQRAVVFIDGDIGKGKSFIGLLLAKQLDGSLCKTFSPTTAGDKFEILYVECSPTYENPLIVILDEVDVILDNVHNKTVPINYKCPTQITNKVTWNTFFDDFNIGLYPYTIIIMTSNKTIEECNTQYDPSYLRHGRCNIIASM